MLQQHVDVRLSDTPINLKKNKKITNTIYLFILTINQPAIVTFVAVALLTLLLL